MIASHQRKLRDGRQYEHLFPTGELENTNPILLERGDTFDTINEMERLIRRYQADTAGVAPLLRGTSLQATCRKVWEWCYQHFQYREDKAGVEQLRRPLRAWKDRRAGIDCDCYSILISTILLNLEIPHKLRKAKYNGKDYYQHIYVIVPEQVGSRRYYTIDPVVDSFNYETPFTAKFDKLMMPIQLLNGVPGATTGAGIGAVIGAGSGAVTGAGIGAVIGASNGATTGRYRPGFGAEFLGIGQQLRGLGSVDSPAVVQQTGLELLAATKLHLENTRAEILRLKEASLYGYADQIRQVLAVWDNPAARDLLLEALSGAEDSQALNGWLGDAWKKVTGAVKQATNWVGTGVKNAAEWVGDKAQDIGQAVVKYNPLSILIRNALLLAWKLNLFRMAERLAIGYLSDGEATANGLNAGEFSKAKSALSKAKAVFEGLQGEKDNMRDAILDGYKRGTSNHNTPRVPGLGVEPTTAAAGTAAATPVIVKIMQWLDSVNWGNLFAVFKKNGNAVNTNYPPPPPDNYLSPSSEQQYLANQQAYDNPKPADNTTTYVVAGVALVGLYFATVGASAS